MAYMRGKDAVVKLGGRHGDELSQCSAWSLNINAPAADVTHIGNTWKQHIQVKKGWTSELALFIDMSDTTQQTLIEKVYADNNTGEPVQFWLKVRDKPAVEDEWFKGSAVISRVVVSNGGVDDVVKANLLLVGHGEALIEDGSIPSVSSSSSSESSSSSVFSSSSSSRSSSSSVSVSSSSSSVSVSSSSSSVSVSSSSSSSSYSSSSSSESIEADDPNNAVRMTQILIQVEFETS